MGDATPLDQAGSRGGGRVPSDVAMQQAMRRHGAAGRGWALAAGEYKHREESRGEKTRSTGGLRLAGWRRRRRSLAPIQQSTGGAHPTAPTPVGLQGADGSSPPVKGRRRQQQQQRYRRGSMPLPPPPAWRAACSTASHCCRRRCCSASCCCSTSSHCWRQRS